MGLPAVLKKKTSFFSIDVELSCPDGQTLALIGPSGSGKTTIIRMLAGLERPDEGCIVYRDRILFDSARGMNLPPQKRKLGYVFQDYSPLPAPEPLRQRRLRGTGATGRWIASWVFRADGAAESASPTRSRAARGSVAPSARPWPETRSCCFSTSPSRRSTWSRGSCFATS